MQWKEFRLRVGYLSTSDLARVEKAFMLARKAHEGQTRMSGEPYFTHPIAVAGMLSDFRADADTLIAAFLHDTVEDTHLTLEEIDHAFNGGVRMLIDGVTKLSKEAFEEKPTLDQQTESLRKMFTLMEQDIRIMVIKLVDRLHNMQTAEFLPEERQKALAQETRDVYVKIADRLSMQDIRDELEALCLKILDPHTFSDLQKLRSTNESIGEAAAQRIQKTLRESKKFGSAMRASFEPVRWEKLREQLETGPAAVTGTTPYAVAIIVSTTDECYPALGVLHQFWQREILSFQDFINNPGINGYRGLHTTIILEDGTRVRCKIRTAEMQEYAHRGISMQCFDSEAEGLLTYLPWTKRIAALSEDTAHHSADFWQSLQSDILGESTIVHGPADEALLLPKEATALDGAFYCLQEKALLIRSIRMNGKDVPLATPIEYASSLDFDLAPEHTVKHEWLKWVRTGLATAHIRRALGEESEEKKIAVGKALLQTMLHKRNGGFLEEFSESTIREAASALGYSSIEAAYASVADGHLDPAQFVSRFTPQKPDAKTSTPQPLLVQYSVDPDNVQSMMQINAVHEEFRTPIRESRYRYWPSQRKGIVRINAHLTEEEAQNLSSRLQAAGAAEMHVAACHPYMKYITAIVIIFWALNPVVAKLLLRDFTPLSLLTLRLLTMSLFTAILYGVWRILRGGQFSPIPHGSALAAIPAAATVALAWFTYVALLTIPPSVHLTIMRFNVLLLPLGYLVSRQVIRSHSIFIITLLVFSITTALLQFSSTVTGTGLLFSILALVFYVFYSLVTERTLQQNKIGIRYPSFLMYVGVFMGIGGVLLALMQPASALWNSMTVPVVLYVLFCVFLPHICFHLILEKVSFRHITDFFLLEVPLAIAFEVLLLGIVLDIRLYLLLLIVLAAIVLIRWKALSRMIG